MSIRSADSKLGDLLADDAARVVLERNLPGITSHPKIGMGKAFPLRTVANFSGGLITPEALQRIDAELRELSNGRRAP